MTPADGTPTGASDDFLVEIHRLVLESDEFRDFLQGFTAVLTTVLSPGGGGEFCCGVTVENRRSDDAVAASDDRARELDQLQARHDDGPCLSAARHGEIVFVEDTRTETRWPAFTSVAAEAGVRSIIAIPWSLDGGERAAINVYADAARTFDAATVAEVRRRAGLMGGALRLALRLSRLRDTEADLRAALDSRTEINLAVGIIMGQNRCSQEEAVALLEGASQRRNVKLRRLAAELVASVGGEAAVTRFDG